MRSHSCFQAPGLGLREVAYPTFLAVSCFPARRDCQLNSFVFPIG
ncbi:hypothetical protein BF49_5677 [Bradyrhizobium sp.]|nr:hypothetical protein BF49_5677 [Bradyrhizobium sp.]